jgi:ribonuclease Z
VTLVSGYLIRVPNHGSILLEAGEGTWGQMCRFFGTDPNKPNNVWEVLRDIKVIFVSHAHGDHHFGLSKILSMRKQVWHHHRALGVVILTPLFLLCYPQLDPPPVEPLFLVTLHSIVLGLRELSDIEDLGLDYSLHNSGVVPIYSFPLAYTQPEYKRGESYRA